MSGSIARITSPLPAEFYGRAVTMTFDADGKIIDMKAYHGPGDMITGS